MLVHEHRVKNTTKSEVLPLPDSQIVALRIASNPRDRTAPAASRASDLRWKRQNNVGPAPARWAGRPVVSLNAVARSIDVIDEAPKNDVIDNRHQTLPLKTQILNFEQAAGGGSRCFSHQSFWQRSSPKSSPIAARSQPVL